MLAGSEPAQSGMGGSLCEADDQNKVLSPQEVIPGPKKGLSAFQGRVINSWSLLLCEVAEAKERSPCCLAL